MKIHLTKNGQSRWCQDYEQDLLESAGWTPVDAKPAAKKAKAEDKSDEVKAHLVAPAMSKSADSETLDNAIKQGDE